MIAGDLLQRGLQHVRMVLREILVGEVEGIAVELLVGRVDQDARIVLVLGDGEIRIPDCPGIDAAGREGRDRVGGREIDRLDVA